MSELTPAEEQEAANPPPPPPPPIERMISDLEGMIMIDQAKLNSLKKKRDREAEEAQ